MLNRPTAWALLLLAATFVAGVVVGVGGRTLWVRHAAAAAPDRPRGIDRFMGELDGELHLTPTQHDSVHAILERHWTRMSAVLETVRPQLDGIRATMDSEVSRQLTPEQQAAYRDHVSRYRHRKEQGQSGAGGQRR